MTGRLIAVIAVLFVLAGCQPEVPADVPPAPIEQPAEPGQPAGPGPDPGPVRPSVPPDPRTGGEDEPPPDGMIAIVIDDMGYGTAGAGPLLELPYPLTFAFLPSAPHVEEQVELARDRGHGVMVHLPMQARARFRDGTSYRPYPGPGYLHSGLTEDEVRELMADHLAKVPGADGANNHMGSEATADLDLMVAVLETVRAEDMFWVDSMTTSVSKGRTAAAQVGVPFAANDEFLDNEIDVDRIVSRVRRLADIARARGFAVGIGHPYAETAEALAIVLPELVAEGIAIVLVSALVEIPVDPDEGSAGDGRLNPEGPTPGD